MRVCFPFLCRGNDFLMEEIVDHNRWLMEGAFDGVVIPNIQQFLLLAELPHSLIQLRPIAPVFLKVDGIIQWYQIWIPLGNVVQNHSLVATPQVQVLQPDQVALVPDLSDDGRHIGNPREDGRDKACGSHTGIVKSLHRGKPSLNTHRAVHILLEILVQSVDGPRHTSVWEGLDKIQIPKHQIRLGGNADGAAAALHLLQQGSGASGRLLQRLIGGAD